MKQPRNRSRILPLLVAGAGAGYLFWSMRRYRRRIDFYDKSVVITGGSRGLGLELARQLAKEGARLVLLARKAAELERARAELVRAGADVLVLTCDVGIPQQVEDAVAAILEMRGSIDVLINAAGVIQVAPLREAGAEGFSGVDGRARLGSVPHDPRRGPAHAGPWERAHR